LPAGPSAQHETTDMNDDTKDLPYGLHVLQRLRCTDDQKLRNADAWVQWAVGQIAQHQLGIVGQVVHIFEGGGGFTAALCLRESHICIHTWPENGQLTFDVFLCNYRRDNAPVARAIALANIHYFDAIIVSNTETKR
jgi:S-adenosylmethionine decarboxylase